MLVLKNIRDFLFSKYGWRAMLFLFVSYLVISGSGLMFWIGSTIDDNIRYYKKINKYSSTLKDIYVGSDTKNMPQSKISDISQIINKTSFKNSKDVIKAQQDLKRYWPLVHSAKDSTYIRKAFEAVDLAFSTEKGERVLDIGIQGFGVIFNVAKAKEYYRKSIQVIFNPPQNADGKTPFFIMNSELTSSLKSGWIYLAMSIMMFVVFLVILFRILYQYRYDLLIRKHYRHVNIPEMDNVYFDNLAEHRRFPLFKLIYEMWHYKGKPELMEEIFENNYEKETEKLNQSNRTMGVLLSWIVRLGILGTLFGVMLAFYEMAQGMMQLKAADDGNGNISSIIKDSMIQALLGNSVAVITSIVAHSATFFLELILGITGLRIFSNRELIETAYLKMQERPEFTMGYRCRVEEHANTIINKLQVISGEASDIGSIAKDIKADVEEIRDNASSINQNTEEISSYTDLIQKNTAFIKDDTTNIVGHTGLIDKHTSDISLNTEKISTQLPSIAAKTNEIKDDTDSIRINNENINRNTIKLSENVQKITSDTEDINEALQEIKKLKCPPKGDSTLIQDIVNFLQGIAKLVMDVFSKDKR